LQREKWRRWAWHIPSMGLICARHGHKSNI
jgi:hypothetical protein